jgi:signal transduction histidine kinase
MNLSIHFSVRHTVRRIAIAGVAAIFILICASSMSAVSAKAFADTLALSSPIFHPSRSLVLTASDASVQAGSSFDILEDPSHALTLDSILTPQQQSRFAPSKQSVPNFGVTQSAYWLRLRLKNTSHEQQWLLCLAYSSLSEVTVYSSHATGRWSSVRTGSAVVFATRPTPHRNFVFPLTLPDSSEHVMYLRVATRVSALVVPATVQTVPAFMVHDYEEQLLNGIIIGVLALTVLYNFILFLSIRDRVYLVYVCYVTGIGLHIANLQGFLKQYVWPEQTGFVVEYVFLLFPALGIAFYALLFVVFFDARRRVPWLHWLLVGVAVFHLVGALVPLVGAPFGAVFGLLSLGSLVFPLLAVVGCVVMIRYGNTSTRYVLAGLSLSMIALCYTVAMGLSLAPYSFWGYYSWPLANTAEMVLFSIALADRINRLRREKEEALLVAKDKELHARQKEAETEIHYLRNIELAAANEEIARQNIELDAANRFKTQMLSIAAHDLKNPLHSILSLSEVIADEVGAESTTQPVLQQIQSTAFRMNALIENVLDAAAIELGNITLRPQEFSLSALLVGIAERYQSGAEKKSQRVVIDIVSDVRYYGDAERLEQVFDNLLSNAVKYSPFGKTIRIRIANTPQFLRVEVQDEGQGVSDEDKTKMFGFFQRLSAQPTGGESSNGVGLAIAKRIVDLHGGRVWCESELEKGATFVVELPQSNGTSR